MEVERLRNSRQTHRIIFILASQVPPIVGIDSMHGANYIKDAPLYPHALHAAASFNARHAYQSGRSAARHTRGAGISWVFAPVVDVAVATRFPRVYECAGEDPRMAEVFGAAIVQGLQGMPFCTEHLQRVLREGQNPGADELSPQPIPEDLSASDVVAACMKHFIGCDFRHIAPALCTHCMEHFTGGGPGCSVWLSTLVKTTHCAGHPNLTCQRFMTIHVYSCSPAER
jgi:beta-glucosidase-like glycosyl hydrolase